MLFDEFRQPALESSRLELVEWSEGESLILEVAVKFVRDRRHHWWWENLRELPKRIQYQDDGLALLDGILEHDTGLLNLVITDDEEAPWPMIVGTWNDLRSYLGSLHFFEFFLFDASQSWMVFDTHHNELLVIGDK